MWRTDSTKNKTQLIQRHGAQINQETELWKGCRYLMEGAQNLLSGVGLEVSVDDVWDHEARGPGLGAHGGRRRRRDAGQDLLQTAVIQLLSRLGRRRIYRDNHSQSKHSHTLHLIKHAEELCVHLTKPCSVSGQSEHCCIHITPVSVRHDLNSDTFCLSEYCFL